MIRKNYVGLISSSQIEEYVGAKGNTLVNHKKGKLKKRGKEREENEVIEKQWCIGVAQIEE